MARTPANPGLRLVAKPDFDVSASLEAIDTLVRAGKTHEATSALRSLKAREIPREALARAANLFRRSGQSVAALRLLNKLVRPERNAPTEATPEEKAEYAVALAYIGANEEALDLLASVPDDRLPLARLYRAMSWISRWEYSKAAAELRLFVASPGANGYFGLVGRVNLAASLVSTRALDEARAVIDELLSEIEGGPNRLLVMNVLELRAQAALAENDFGTAASALDAVAREEAAQSSVWGLVLRKWRAVLELKRAPQSSARALDDLRGVRAAATQARSWEVVRDCDQWLAQYEGSLELFEHLYYGSPYPEYRARIVDTRQKATGTAWTPGASYDRKLKGGRGPVVDVDLGRIVDRADHLPTGQLLHRLMALLTEDFYRPYRLATLYGRLHPDRHYDPTHSPPVIQQLLIRLRTWLGENELPLSVVFEEPFYRYEASGGLTLRLSPQVADSISTQSKTLSHSKALKDHFGQNPFSSAHAAPVMGVNVRTAKRVLREAVGAGVLKIEGRGRLTRYRAA